MAIGVGANRASGETREPQRFDLIEITARTASNEAHRSKSLVGGAHDFAKRRPNRRVVEILEHHYYGTGELREARHLF
ncbi:hypothetical protein HRbin36_00207 [bacterium HR36]|nr:hypothetical protein HRbin36_00207 [bacterium HR36]